MSPRLNQPRHYTAHGPVRCARCLEPAVASIEGECLCKDHAYYWMLDQMSVAYNDLLMRGANDLLCLGTFPPISVDAHGGLSQDG